MRKIDTTQIKENISTWTKEHKELIAEVAIVGANCFVWYTLGKVVQNKRDNVRYAPQNNITKEVLKAVPDYCSFRINPFRNENIGKFNQMNRVIEILDDPEAREEILGVALFTRTDN